MNRVTHNKIELDRQTVDARAIARDALEVMAAAIREKRLTLHEELGSVSILVDADPARLQQIVVNLVGNAVKYTPVGGHAWVAIRRDAGDAIITIRDDGIGIDQSMLASIFELFVQAESTLARVEGGLGVGLALVRALVEMHGGTVSASSNGLGAGSEFTVRLPIATATEPRIPASGIRLAELPARLTIAVVDDNSDSCDLLRIFLETKGCVVSCAYDGAAGLELIERTKPDVALIDIGLPQIDGYGVAQRLRAAKETSSLLLIALTGYGRASDRESAIAAGFDEHLVKPVQPEDLESALSRCVANGGPRARARTDSGSA